MSFLVELWERLAFGVILCLLTVLAVGLEFRKNYVEDAIGRYLAWHNASRLESGSIWETVSLSENVQQKLDDLVHSRQQEAALDEKLVGSLVELVELVFYRENVIMTRGRFLDTYTGLPLYQSSLLVEPVELVDLIGRLPDWQRTLIAFEQGELKFYLVDGLNNILEEITLAGEYVNFLLSEKENRTFGLEAFPSFRENQYPAEVFYAAWALLSPQARSGIPLSPVELISWRFRLQRVGIDQRSLIGDRLEMGFELSSDEGLITVRLLGRSMAVLSLIDEMDALLGTQQQDGEGSVPDSLTGVPGL